MKKIVLLMGLIAGMGAALFAQNAALPRLAVVEFTTNANTDKVKTDAITVRELVESEMVKTGKYQIITRDDIDKLLENQRIQVSSIASSENLKKLQLQNISYIVTGSLNAMGNDYSIAVRVLDVSTGGFSHSDNDFMGGGSRELYNGITGLMAKFVKGMSADSSGSIVQSQSLGINTAQARLDRGKVFYDRREYDVAISELNEAIKLDPNLAEAFAYRAMSYIYSNNNLAVADANTAIRLNPNLAVAYLARGITYRNKDDFNSAIVDYTQAIKLDPNYAIAYSYRGDGYRNRGDYDRAIEDYSIYIRLNPNYDYGYYARGLMYSYKGDYDRAIVDYTQAIRLEPNNAIYYQDRGRAYEQKRDYDRTIADYEAALRIQPNLNDVESRLKQARKRGR